MAQVSLSYFLILVWPFALKNYIISLRIKYQSVLSVDCMKKVELKIPTGTPKGTGWNM